MLFSLKKSGWKLEVNGTVVWDAAVRSTPTAAHCRCGRWLAFMQIQAQLAWRAVSQQFVCTDKFGWIYTFAHHLAKITWIFQQKPKLSTTSSFILSGKKRAWGNARRHFISYCHSLLFLLRPPITGLQSCLLPKSILLWIFWGLAFYRERCFFYAEGPGSFLKLLEELTQRIGEALASDQSSLWATLIREVPLSKVSLQMVLCLHVDISGYSQS